VLLFLAVVNDLATSTAIGICGWFTGDEGSDVGLVLLLGLLGLFSAVGLSCASLSGVSPRNFINFKVFT
jgi:hypothetical protein